MMGKVDSLSIYDDLLDQPWSSPWNFAEESELPLYEPDTQLLGQLLSRPVSSGAMSESGIFAGGIDAWIAQELRRAGFATDEVWPRATRPRILPRDISILLDRLPRQQGAALRERLDNLPSVAPVDARVLGRAYEKQVDVVISRWDRGPEVLISTKAQLSSFGKNLPNRFEEAYGDAGNLRGRYPLAAVGYLFVQRATITKQEPDAFERSVDMIRKLRDRGDGNGYNATALLLVDWEPLTGNGVRVQVMPDLVPVDIQAGQFFTRVIDRVLTVTPVTAHVRVRELRENRKIAVPDLDQAAGPSTRPASEEDLSDEA